MHPPGADTILIRYGEIGIKSSQLQQRLEQLLEENLTAVLRAMDTDDVVRRERTRLYVETTPNRIDSVTEAVTQVPGVVSASPAVRTEPTLAAIKEVLVETAVERIDSGTLAVRARRAGEKEVHPFTSTELEQEGGAAVVEALREKGVTPEVDLETPDTTLYIECREHDAYVFLEKENGPGGFPVGSQEPMVALLSGGIDSPVAAWSAMKRGCPIYPVYIDLGEYGGIDHRTRALETARQLSKCAPNWQNPVRVATGGPGVARIVEEAESLRMPVLRRFMFRIAEDIAEEVGAVGIVTGESIGQKSSQTSAMLSVTSEITTLPIIRPLVTLDKTEIVDKAKEIGTYRDSTISAGCNRIAPDRPATKPSLSVVQAAEPEDIAGFARDAAESADIISTKELIQK